MHLAVEALVAHKLRSGLTLLGVLIGVGGVLVIDSVTQAQTASVSAGLGRLGAKVVSVSPSAPTARGLANTTRSGPTLRPTDADSLRQLPHVLAVSPEITASEQLANGWRSARTTVTAATPDIQLIQGWRVRSGAFYTARDETSAKPVAMLGETVVERLFPDGTSPLGQPVRIRNADFNVVGVLTPKGHDGGSDLDDIVLVPFSAGQQRLFGTTWIGLLQLQVDGTDTNPPPPAVIAGITQTLERSHHVRPGQPDDFRVQSYQQLVDRARPQVELLTTLMRGIAVAALAMGGFGLMNILLLGVTERTMELGLRMAVGARQADVLVQFLVEAVTLALIGGLLGMLAAVGVGRAVAAVFGSLALYIGVPSPGAIGSALGLTVGLGLVFGTYPAFRAARLDPVDALRSE
jgi:putative ABC transport system permease protein